MLRLCSRAMFHMKMSSPSKFASIASKSHNDGGNGAHEYEDERCEVLDSLCCYILNSDVSCEVLENIRAAQDTR